jgi:hypothetical protein
MLLVQGVVCCGPLRPLQVMSSGEEDGGGGGCPTEPGGRRNVAVGGAGLYLLMRMYHIVYQRLAMVRPSRVSLSAA